MKYERRQRPARNGAGMKMYESDFTQTRRKDKNNLVDLREDWKLYVFAHRTRLSNRNEIIPGPWG